MAPQTCKSDMEAFPKHLLRLGISQWQDKQGRDPVEQPELICAELQDDSVDSLFSRVDLPRIAKGLCDSLEVS